jgi:hypothetical protein
MSGELFDYGKGPFKGKGRALAARPDLSKENTIIGR